MASPEDRSLRVRSDQLAARIDIVDSVIATQQDATLTSQQTKVVLMAAVVALYDAHPDKARLHASFQCAWNVARGALGVPDMPDENNEEALSLVRQLSGALRKMIL